jgi:hypothetical protein
MVPLSFSSAFGLAPTADAFRFVSFVMLVLGLHVDIIEKNRICGSEETLIRITIFPYLSCRFSDNNRAIMQLSFNHVVVC